MKILLLMFVITQAPSLFAFIFTSSTPTEVCRLPPIHGPCKAALKRWFYNRREGVCEKFIYGGCRGNGNNFRTKEECEARCGAPVDSFNPENIYELPQGKNCAPGTTWKNQCSVCSCDQEGVGFFCTLMGCPEGEKGVVKRCAPNSRWRNECNTCRCSPSGQPRCTLMGCGQFQLDTATNQYELPQGKNYTSRTRNTQNNVLCTNEGCLEEELTTSTETDDLPQGKECAIGTRWKSQCNKCRCISIGAICTQKRCPGEEMDAVIQCAPNSRWRNECNTCWCLPNGVPVCTLARCA